MEIITLILIIIIGLMFGVLLYCTSVDWTQQRIILMTYGSIGFVFVIWTISLACLHYSERKKFVLLSFSTFFFFGWLSLGVYMITFRAYSPFYQFFPTKMKTDNVNASFSRPNGCSVSGLDFRIESMETTNSIIWQYHPESDVICLTESVCQREKICDEQLAGTYSVWMTCKRIFLPPVEIKLEDIELILPQQSLPKIQLDHFKIYSENFFQIGIWITIPFAIIISIILFGVRMAIRTNPKTKINDYSLESA